MRHAPPASLTSARIPAIGCCAWSARAPRKAKIPLTPATEAALEAYLADRAQRTGVGEWRQLSGPLLATASGGRLRQGYLWELVRRLARTAGIGGWEQLSPHCLRHSAITFALDAGASLRDVQDYAGHKDPRTTRQSTATWRSKSAPSAALQRCAVIGNAATAHPTRCLPSSRASDYAAPISSVSSPDRRDAPHAA